MTGLVDHWIFLSLATALFFGVQSVLLKKLSTSLNQQKILKYLFLIAGILLLPIAFINRSTVDLQRFFIPFLISLAVNTLAYRTLITALKYSPVSIVMPFVGSTPLFLTVTSYFILNESITGVQLIGILLIIFGAFILQFPHTANNRKNQSWISLLFNTKEKGIGLGILVAFLWSISASVEKLAVQASSPEFYGAAIHLSLGVVFFLLARFNNEGNNRQSYHLPYFLLFALGLTSALLAIAQLTAIKITLVANVIAFKRAGIILSSVAGFILFKEGNALKSLSGTLFILCGAYFISM